MIIDFLAVTTSQRKQALNQDWESGTVQQPGSQGNITIWGNGLNNKEVVYD